MIQFSEIRPNEVVKVLVNCDDIEEETFARVVDCFTTTMMVRYFEPMNIVYKGACAYQISEKEEPVGEESLVEHYAEGTSPFLEKNGYFFLEDEVDKDDSDSEIENLSDDESLEDFVVSDNVEGWQPPPGHAEIDKEWEKWTPSTTGAKRFKETVDRIEELARLQADELSF